MDEEWKVPRRWILCSIIFIVIQLVMGLNNPEQEIGGGGSVNANSFILWVFVILLAAALAGPIVDFFYYYIVGWIRFLGMIITWWKEIPPAERVSSNTYGSSHSRGCNCYYCNGQYSADSSGD